MRIATWNVNSVNARLENLLAWLEEAEPDVACLQEIKCVDEKFPASLRALGYNVATHGQKTYNGVAMLSKHPWRTSAAACPATRATITPATSRRWSGAERHGARRLASTCPTAIPIATEKFAYKLAWMDRLRAHARELLALEEPLVLAGDYNVIPEPRDAADPENWVGDALFQPESRGALPRAR